MPHRPKTDYLTMPILESVMGDTLEQQRRTHAERVALEQRLDGCHQPQVEGQMACSNTHRWLVQLRF